MLSKLEVRPLPTMKSCQMSAKIMCTAHFYFATTITQDDDKECTKTEWAMDAEECESGDIVSKSFTQKLSSTLNLIAVGTICCVFLSRTKCYEMISSCNPAASADDSEGGGKRSRRRSPARTCIVPFSYLSQIPTASHLFADHFQGPQGLKGGGPGEGKCHSLLRQDTCRRPGPSSNPP